MSLKAVYDREVPSGNLLTTITGVLSLVISGLTLFGVLTSEDAAKLTEFLVMGITAVAGIVGIFFAKDDVVEPV